MRTSALISILVGISFFASGQIDTIPQPTGYSTLLLRSKNVIRVSPDDHLWVGFRSIGAGEYDGNSWRMYSDTTGLPSNNVTSFAFNGNLKWIGTDEGLVKTDGFNLVSYNTFNSPMPSNMINDLFMADTVLWIATDSGVVEYDGTNFNIYNTSNSGLTTNYILSLNKNSFGMYAITSNGIFNFRNNIWKYIGTLNNGPYYRLVSDKAGNLFSGIYQIIDTSFIQVFIPPDPCYYLDDNISVPLFITGGSVINKTYALSNFFNSERRYAFEFDSQMNIVNSYLMDSSVIWNSSQGNIQLFDFNSSGEIISATNVLPISDKIYKTNFSLYPELSQPDSCPYLDINQVRTRVWNNGSMFWDLEGESLYEVPRGSGNNAIFSEGFLLGGKDDQGKLHIAAQSYRQSGNDFWPGPLDTTNATIDPATFQFYDKLWKIDRYTVLDFIFNFQNGNVTNGSYPIPDIIQNWPAHGNGNISRSLAPFVDHNSDGLYNPLDGDYPDIKGDQMFWWVFNDNYSSHGETGSLYNLGVEIHGMAYAFSCPQIVTGDSVINYTTFYHYDIFNRSDTNYSDVLVGLYTDIDLGNWLDDFVGCDTVNDIGFVYNGDNVDENSYGVNPPMINIAYLKGPEAPPNDGLDNNHNGVIDEPGEVCMMSYYMYHNNDGTPTGNPHTATEYYYRMQGIWSDSTHVVNPITSSLTNYMFSGTPYDTINGWSETNPCNGCTPNEPGDRRFLTSSGPFNLPAHGKKSLDYAYVFTREPNAPNGPNTSLAVNLDHVLRIKQFFNTDSFPCSHLIGIDELEKEEIVFDLYPNPASSEISITIKNENGSEKFYSITDVLGREITGSRKIKSSTFKLNVQSFATGLYFISIRSKNSMSVSKFVVED